MANLQWQIGDVRVTRIVESVNPMPPSGLLPEASGEALAPHLGWLQPHFVTPEGHFLLSIHGLVVESQGRCILVDTCVGDRDVPGFDGMRIDNNPFLRELEAAGFGPDSIDTVLCTHLHFDHVGWNTVWDGSAWVPTFPNAQYLFARTEYEHWSSESELGLSPTFPDAVKPVVDAGLATLVEMDHAVTDEVRFEPTAGHTPGHVSVRISSGGSDALITGDMTHHPVQWAEPQWTMTADSDSAAATETRRRVLKQYGDGPVLVIGTHYAEPTAGYLRSKGDGYYFEV